MKISVFTEIKDILIYERKNVIYLLYVIRAEYNLIVLAKSHCPQNKQSKWRMVLIIKESFAV